MDEMDLISLNSNPPNLQVAVRTLTIGGFALEKASRFPGFALIYMYRYDEFGVKQQYCFSLFENEAEAEQIQSAEIAAKHNKAELVIIGPTQVHEKPNVVWNRFLNLFGGPVYSYSPLEPDFGDYLRQLGFNTLPAGLDGKPDDLFELYVHKALEFIFGCKVHRYGQERRFEARPDGIIIQDKMFSALYDAKAYSNGYDVSLDSIRQFSSYVTEFRNRYSQYFDLNTFIVISGSFPHSKETLEGRSRQFLSEASIPLVFLTAESVVQIIDLLSNFPSARRSINWRKIFVNPVVDPALVKAELQLINKDKIIVKNKS
jgi:hypothetical protein